MSERPKAAPGDWIHVGSGEYQTAAVVCQVRDRSPELEVVYLDERKRAINEDVKWVDDHWEFAIAGPAGGYADNYPRLANFVRILRDGRYPPWSR